LRKILISSTQKIELINELGGAEMRTGTMTVSDPNLISLSQGIQTENKPC